MIQVENLTKEYGDFRAVDNLSFEVYEGEILGFLGPNGAGKTTTMRILTCFFPPTSGTARVAGYDVLEDPDNVRRVIGYMPEGVPLYREMTVRSALDFVAHAKGYGRADRKRFVAAAIDETGLSTVADRVIGHLSKGFRQRVGLAQALLGEPKVLILDEPTAGLDPRQIAEVRTLIRNMRGRRTVILSTHILPEVQMTCSRVLIINDGRIAASGTPEKLTGRVQNRFTVIARVIGPPEQVLPALRAIPGVTAVEQRDGSGLQGEAFARGWTGASVEYAVTAGIETPDVRPDIAEICVSRMWRLVELRQIGISLEEIFLKVISSDEPAEQPDEEPAEAPADV
jgi:ABC-2 type transport system ATP-binding protein